MTTSSVAKSDRQMHAKCCAHSQEAVSTEETEVVGVLTNRKDIIHALPSHVVSKDPPHRKQVLVDYWTNGHCASAAARGTMISLSGSFKNILIAFVTFPVSSIEKLLNVMLQEFVNNAIDEKLVSVEYENCFLHKTEIITALPVQMPEMAEAMLDNQDFFVPVALIVK